MTSSLQNAIKRAHELDRKDVKGQEFTRLLTEGMTKLKKKHKAEMQKMCEDLYDKIYKR